VGLGINLQIWKFVKTINWADRTRRDGYNPVLVAGATNTVKFQL
jgi:hypothetical protein